MPRSSGIRVMWTPRQGGHVRLSAHWSMWRCNAGCAAAFRARACSWILPLEAPDPEEVSRRLRGGLRKRNAACPGGSHGSGMGQELPRPAQQCGTRCTCLEDGFLRSVGLGADLTAPLSWVCDDLGLYYDPSCPSRLERILAEATFSQDLLERAAYLCSTILAAGITKYNLREQSADTFRRPRRRKRASSSCRARSRTTRRCAMARRR